LPGGASGRSCGWNVTGRTTAVSEKRIGRASTSFGPQLKTVRLSQIYVLDQDEALDFYVGKLGLEVNTDADLGFMRWLTVSVAGDPDREILLERPGPPALDDSTAEQVRELVSKGATGGWIGFTTDDVRKTYEDLRAKGVEFTQEPVEQSYGTDVGLRDPFGNAIRILQPR
jgi:catechol 2,3-dioxygenase-like lactoylglutathione lyase family enzyme